MSVSVVITTFNHARFLGQAIESVLAQTHPATEVIVVDDGSTDSPESVVGRWPDVRLIRRPNGGLSAARNTGLRAVRCPYVLFLDADDLLTPFAIEAGLRCFAQHPEAAFVYGAYRILDGERSTRGSRWYEPASGDTYAGMLRGNFVAMHGAVLYRRDVLEELRGFDEGLRRCEDYDLYLRVLQRYPVASHPVEVARYRWHDENISSEFRAMLRTALRVHTRHRPSTRSRGERRRAWREGRRNWRELYTRRALTSESARYRPRAVRALHAARVSPTTTVRMALGHLARRGAGRLPRRMAWRLAGVPPRTGQVRLGDLREVRPISAYFGFDRGLPIDRYYIEQFLERHALDIRGRVLEVGDASYCERFGGDRVVAQDVLHVHGDNPMATIVGDLGTAGTLPRDAFDCIVLTQTLQYVYDVGLAIRQLAEALTPGGVLLLTVPGITPVDRGEWGSQWYWSFTPQAVERLLAQAFTSELTMVEARGNVLAATAFLQGLAFEEVDRKKLDVADPAFPVVVTARAQRTMRASGGGPA